MKYSDILSHGVFIFMSFLSQKWSKITTSTIVEGIAEVENQSVTCHSLNMFGLYSFFLSRRRWIIGGNIDFQSLNHLDLENSSWENNLGLSDERVYTFASNVKCVSFLLPVCVITSSVSPVIKTQHYLFLAAFLFWSGSSFWVQFPVKPEQNNNRRR